MINKFVSSLELAKTMNTCTTWSWMLARNAALRRAKSLELLVSSSILSLLMFAAIEVYTFNKQIIVFNHKRFCKTKGRKKLKAHLNIISLKITTTSIAE